MRDGRKNVEAGDAKKGLNYFFQYVRLKPNDPIVHFWIGLAYDQLDEYENAVRAYSRSLQLAQKLEMDSSELRVNLGNSLMRLNYLKEAIFDYERAIEIEPRNGLAHLYLAKALLQNNECETAFEELTKCGELGITDNSIPYLKALALKGQGKSEEAKQQFQIFISSNSGNSQAIESAKAQLAELSTLSDNSKPTAQP